MNESYLIINGKRIDLTPEQLATLGIEPPKKSPFERVKGTEQYFVIDIDGSVNTETEYNSDYDNACYANANYCTDQAMMEQRALHEILNRRLWRYSVEHYGEKIDRKNADVLYSIYRHTDNAFYVGVSYGHIYMGETYFVTKGIAEAAIEEIVKPFMEEHPEFVW